MMRYWYVVSGVKAVSLKDVVAVVPATLHVAPPFADRSTRYPVAPLLAAHPTLISVDETTEAVTDVGAAGGVTSVVADAVAEGSESPPAFVAITRYV
jgi:hypothetical protein